MGQENTLNQQSKYCDSKGRLYFYDNAKFILIFLVVLAHVISPFKSGSESTYVVWKIINSMHMPCLIFISGFFAKRYIQPGGGLKVQRTFSYFMLYIFSQIAISVFEVLVLDKSISPSLLSARSSLWFLQCLGVWYLILPFFEKFRPEVLLTASIIIGLIIGYDQSAFNILAISRVFVHFPFFMAGYFCTPELITKLFNKKVRIAAVVTLVVCAVFFCFFNNCFFDGIITCNYPYAKVNGLQDFPYALRWVFRLSFYLFAFILSAAFLAVVPRKKNIFTRFGSRTLAVYILHRFLYLCWTELGWWEYFKDMKYVAVINILISVAVTLILSLKPFSYPFDLIQKISINRLLDKKKIK